MASTQDTRFVSYHFVITLAFASGMVDAASTYDAAPGETRSEIYKKILDWAKQRATSTGSHTGEGVVVFFSLEPDKLGA